LSCAKANSIPINIPYTMPHFPVTPAPEFDGKTGNGSWADALAQMDSYTGELLDTVGICRCSAVSSALARTGSSTSKSPATGVVERIWEALRA
jgi:hypothetical protein